MADPGFYNQNVNRAFPFVKDTVGNKTATAGTIEALPNGVIADAGFVMGLESGFVSGQHSVWLKAIHRVSSVVTFTFISDAPGLFQRKLVFTRHLSDPDYVTEHVEDDQSQGNLVSEVPTFCSSVIQMGTSGTLVASCTGQLRLLFNDDYRADNSGSYSVTIAGQTYVVDPRNTAGVVGPHVTAGTSYPYTATGTITWRVSPAGHSNASGPTDDTIQTATDGFTVPGLTKWSLIGIILGTPPVTAPSETAGCEEEPLWSGYLVTGSMAALATLGDGVTRSRTTGGLVEPALIQNMAGSYVASLNLANQDRTRVDAPIGCSDHPHAFPVGDDVVYVSARCLRGNVRFKAGYNAIVEQASDANTITIGAGKAAGEGQPCHEVTLFPGEIRPPGSKLLEGGPQCDEVVRSLNGVGGQFGNILNGTGVKLTLIPAKHTIIVDVNMDQLAACYSELPFSDVSESLSIGANG